MPSFVELISPPRFRERVAELCQTDPSVTVLSYMLGADRLLEWAHSVAVLRDETLQASVSPVPPLELRNITAAPEAEVFLWTGLVDLATLYALYERYGPKPAGRAPRFLDFGCGCGRMTRYLNLADSIEAYGMDMNPDLVAWCQGNLARVRTILNTEQPPMAFPDNLFDLVYGLSVFTHLPEQRARHWLQDIRRALAPGGLLIVTTHGYPALEIIRKSSIHQQMFDLDEPATDEVIARLGTEGFVFNPYPPEGLRAARTSAAYGNSFTHPDYISEQWNTAELQVVEHIPGGLRGWQDIVVLRRV